MVAPMPLMCPSISTVAAVKPAVVEVVGKKVCGDKVGASKGWLDLVGAKVEFLVGFVGYKMDRPISQQNSTG